MKRKINGCRYRAQIHCSVLQQSFSAYPRDSQRHPRTRAKPVIRTMRPPDCDDTRQQKSSRDSRTAARSCRRAVANVDRTSHLRPFSRNFPHVPEGTAFNRYFLFRMYFIRVIRRHLSDPPATLNAIRRCDVVPSIIFHSF